MFFGSSSNRLSLWKYCTQNFLLHAGAESSPLLLSRGVRRVHHRDDGVYNINKERGRTAWRPGTRTWGNIDDETFFSFANISAILANIEADDDA